MLSKADIDSVSTGWAKKLTLRVDNFATVRGKKACDMSNVL